MSAARGFRIVEALSPELRAAELSVRWDVFVLEQGVPMVLEIDARDARLDVRHLVALVDEDASGGTLDPGSVIGCVRLITDGPGAFHLGRLAVRREGRGTGCGAALVRAVEALVEELTPAGDTARILLDAQVQARGFYEALGYVATSERIFMDAGIEHVEMALVVGGRASH